MAIIDTTNVVESSIFLKSKLKKNMVADNYYIDSLQNKINREWIYRSNLVDIEEENNIQNHYTKEKPLYTPVESVIQSVITDKGEKLADDWKKLVFKNLKHSSPLGKRFRFSLNFEKNIEYIEVPVEIEKIVEVPVEVEKIIEVPIENPTLPTVTPGISVEKYVPTEEPDTNEGTEEELQ